MFQYYLLQNQHKNPQQQHPSTPSTSTMTSTVTRDPPNLGTWHSSSLLSHSMPPWQSHCPTIAAKSPPYQARTGLKSSS